MSERLMGQLIDAVKQCDIEKTKELVVSALRSGFDPLGIVEEGLAEGIRLVGDMFAKGEAFLPELIMAAEAMKAGLEVLQPELGKRGEKRKTLGMVIIGTVQGDLHDIGKNIVAAMLEANGFEVIDLGVDIPRQKFVEEIKKRKPDIIGLSALLTSTLPEQRKVIEAIKVEGLKVKVMVGGAPVTQKWTEEIGADAYGSDALDAVEKAMKLVGGSFISRSSPQ